MRSSYSGKVMGPKISSWTLPRIFMPAPWITRILAICSSVGCGAGRLRHEKDVALGRPPCAGRVGRRQDHEERHNYWKPQTFRSRREPSMPSCLEAVTLKIQATVDSSDARSGPGL